MSLPQFTTDSLIDFALRAAIYSVIQSPQVSRANVMNILEIFSGESDADAAITLTIAHILRQEARGEINRKTSRELVKILLRIKEEGGEEKGELARRFLGYYRWLFDVLEKMKRMGFRIDLREVPNITFRDFLKRFVIGFSR